jgi:hypothetical protein
LRERCENGLPLYLTCSRFSANGRLRSLYRDRDLRNKPSGDRAHSPPMGLAPRLFLGPPLLLRSKRPILGCPILRSASYPGLSGSPCHKKSSRRCREYCRNPVSKSLDRLLFAPPILWILAHPAGLFQVSGCPMRHEIPG